jgi:predicted HicB family RNase H-like nuclease
MPGKSKTKVGRPSLGKDARNVVLQSRVQESEKEAYQKAAKAEKKDLSTWVRETLNQAIKA